MLKLVSGQHTKAPGSSLRGTPALSAPPSTEANLSLLANERGQALSRPPATATSGGPQQLLQQQQQQQSSSIRPASATPRTPQNLLAMVHLLDQQLQQLEEQYDGEQPPNLQDAGLQARRQQGHSVEAPAILSAQSQVPPAAAAAGVQTPYSAGATALSDAKLACSGQHAAQHSYRATAQQQRQLQHTVEVPSLVSNNASPSAQQKSAASRQQVQAQCASIKRMPQVGSKAADQVPQHNRGLLAAGAYVLQPLKPAAGPPRQRSRSPVEQPWLQHVDTMGGPKVPPVAVAAPRQPTQQLLPPPRPLQIQQIEDLQEPASQLIGAGADFSAEAAAMSAAAARAVQEPRADLTLPNAMALQHHQMLQQQQHQQAALRLLAEHQQYQHRRQQQQQQQQALPPRQQQQQQRQLVQDTAEDMELDDAAGALDMLSEIAAAAAAAEEMYTGVPSPLRPDLLNTHALGAGSFTGSNRAQAARKPDARSSAQPGRRTSDSSGSRGAAAAAAAAANSAAAAAAATNIPAAAAAAIAAATAARQEAPRLQQGFNTPAAGYHAAADRAVQTKRSRGIGGAAATHVAAPTALSAGTSPAGAAGVRGSRDTKRTRTAADKASGGQASGLAPQHSHDSSMDELSGEAAALAAGGPELSATIRAAVAELAAMAAAGGLQPAPMAASAPSAAQWPAAAPGSRAPEAPQLSAPGGPLAFLFRDPQAAASTAYLLFPQGNPYAAAAAGAAQASVGPTAQADGRAVAPRAADAAAVSAAISRESQGVSVARRPAVKHAPRAAAAAQQTAAEEELEAAEAADAAAHDLAMFAAAAAAAAAAGTYHSGRAAAVAAPVRPAAAAASDLQNAGGRRQRRSAAAAAAFIAAAVAGTDDGTALVADDDYEEEDEEEPDYDMRAHRRHQHTHAGRQQSLPPAGTQQHLELLAAASASGSPVGAAAAAPAAAAAGREGPGPAFAVNPALAALAASNALPWGSSRSSRSHGSSVSGNYTHDADYNTDGTDAGVYGLEGEAQEDSEDDEERRPSSKNRSTKERVLSNRLAASRSYQRRKEEMLRLESNHARLQMEHQALQHALQEIDSELQVHQEITAAFASHHQANAGILSSVQTSAAPAALAGQDQHAAAAAFAAGHAAMHGMLAQRVHGACQHQQRQRQLHANMVEEAALAAAAAAEGFHTDGAGSSQSGSVGSVSH